MATIDHLYFPHIIDIIWQQLDYDGQVAVRGVSRDWKRRADARLSHIVISCFERPGPRVFDLSTRDLTKPSFRAWLGQVCHFFNSDRHEWECGCENWRQCAELICYDGDRLAVHLDRTCLSTTNVVDFVGFDLKWPHVPDLSGNSLIRNILLDPRCIVRCFGGFLDLSDFKDYCDHPDHRDHDCEPSLVDVYMWNFGPESPLHKVYPYDLSMREDVQVINYLCVSDPTANLPKLSSAWSEYFNDPFCPVTVILLNGIPPENRAPPSKEPGLVAVYADLVHGGNEVVIVGLEEFFDLEDTQGYIDIVERQVLKGRHKYDYDEDGDVW